MNKIIFDINDFLNDTYEHLYHDISVAIKDDVISDYINECIYDVIVPLIIKIPFNCPLTLGQVDRVAMAAYVYFKNNSIKISSFTLTRIIEDLTESEAYITLRRRVKRSLVMVPQLRNYHHKFKIDCSAAKFIVYY